MGKGVSRGDEAHGGIAIFANVTVSEAKSMFSIVRFNIKIASKSPGQVTPHRLWMTSMESRAVSWPRIKRCARY